MGSECAVKRRKEDQKFAKFWEIVMDFEDAKLALSVFQNFDRESQGLIDKYENEGNFFQRDSLWLKDVLEQVESIALGIKPATDNLGSLKAVEPTTPRDHDESLLMLPKTPRLQDRKTRQGALKGKALRVSSPAALPPAKEDTIEKDLSD